ncbi:MAG TPA: DUF2252 domain-containing protein [Solirubrobacteraceae bacterium]
MAHASQQAGRAARQRAPRSAHALWEAAPDRRDPVATLERQAATRTPELVPVRYGRMARSPFAFFRGAAAIMAADLAATAVTGLQAQLCGDAHLANFGGFAAPDRSLVFDLNDFDETLPGPWEWDVKRLAASVAVAARDRGFDGAAQHDIVVSGVRAYREAMRAFAAMRTIDVWYARLDVERRLAEWGRHLDTGSRKELDHAVAKARRKNSLRALSKLTYEVDGGPRIVSDPPLIVPIGELLGADAAPELARLEALLRDYRRSLPPEVRELAAGYQPVDLAHKVVGVGSVGLRAWIVLLLGRDDADPLFLQVKEAQASVLEPFARRGSVRNQGQRVVRGQRLMQAAGDILLGWLRVEEDIGDGRPRDYYVRQLWDAKGSVPIELLSASELSAYAETCGWTLARAHARSADRVAIGAYLGASDRFDRAVAAFAELYADQNERDHVALVAAIRAGRIAADPDH